MKVVAVIGVLAGVIVAGCSALPTAGPTVSDVKSQEIKDNLTRFDLVEIDDNVVAALLALPAESFHVLPAAGCSAPRRPTTSRPARAA